MHDILYACSHFFFNWLADSSDEWSHILFGTEKDWRLTNLDFYFDLADPHDYFFFISGIQ